MTLKVCTKCHEPKGFDEFPRQKAMSDGRSSWCRRCANELSRECRDRQRYGLEPGDYDVLLAEQGGVCAICRGARSDRARRRLAVDHDHETGEIRGLLCAGCNTTLGRMGDSIEGVERFLAYLRRPVMVQLSSI